MLLRNLYENLVKKLIQNIFLQKGVTTCIKFGIITSFENSHLASNKEWKHEVLYEYTFNYINLNFDQIRAIVFRS